MNVMVRHLKLADLKYCYDKRHMPCLHGLINHDPTQQKQCPLRYYLQPPPFAEVTTGELNRLLVSTGDTLYHHQCPNSKPVTGKFKRGHYLIDIEARCVLDASVDDKRTANNYS